MAIVIGPTPPGTGVIAPATSPTGPKSTSPTRPSSVRLMPTSMTVAPCFTMSAVIMRARPTAAADLGQVARARVADRDGGAAMQQQERHRLADDVRAADDDRVGPLELHPGRIEQLHDAGGRAGDEPGLPGNEPADVQRVEAVD